VERFQRFPIVTCVILHYFVFSTVDHLSMESTNMRRWTCFHSWAFFSFLREVSPLLLSRSALTTTALLTQQRRETSLQMSSTDTWWIGAISQAVSEALGESVKLEASTGAGSSGGGGATTSVVQDPQSQTKYFVKSAADTPRNRAMLQGEYMGVQEMAKTKTIRVPNPIALGHARSRTFLVLEYLHFTSGSSQFELGQQLAQMHRTTSPNGHYGFSVDNTIGATFQPNLPWYAKWEDFWLEHRLNHMLSLTGNVGISETDIELLRQKVRSILSRHSKVQPSLVHGDLWGGNKGFCKDDPKGSQRIVPCIFDPAAYYGDREVDIAMTHVFGGFGKDFYDGYDSVWPLSEGHEQRREIYNLYHILNHDVLFGGGYRSQARNIIYEILRF
jgi:fructosamine-3-kinase